MDSEKNIYFITGASGVGKTTVLNMLKEKYKGSPWAFLHFDEIGVPSLSDMIEEFGSPSAWQEARAYEWIHKAVYIDSEKIFLEAQVNLQFIRNGFDKLGFTKYKIILLDCSEEEMEKRLTYHRGQPELFNKNMRNWLRYLRNQANQFGAVRIDTTGLSETETMSQLQQYLKLDAE